MYERYINKNNRLFVVLNRWQNCTEIDGNLVFYPTTVNLLDVAAEKVTEFKHADFEAVVSDGRLKRLLPTP